MPGVKRNLTTLSMEKKYEALIALDKKELDRKAVCVKYNIANSTLTGWIADKKKIFESVEQSSISSKIMRFRTTDHKEVEEALVEWIREARQSGLRLSRGALQAQSV
jgi:hypothetical protein